MYSKLKSRDNGLTALFECITGTREDCMLSPFLFILYLNELVHMCNKTCPGLFLNESTRNVHVLLYDNDVAMVNDTIGRSQRQLNIMGEFCSKYSSCINMTKTHVIIFTNGGRLRTNEKWYINNGLLIETTYNKYLGVMFSSRLCWF